MIEVIGSTEDSVQTAVADVLAAEELPLERVRKGKATVADVRPAILTLEVAGPTDNGVLLSATLATESVSLRPAELVRVLGDDLVEGSVRRTHQWIIVDGARCEPVSPPVPSTRHDMKRAS
jgi:flavin-binding protein dodecin